ncbi:MAG TPA: class I SAM-dependent methyltransferase [Casimicrobiaceae bacterium]|nr:class I SAM-dependent methyltransferase [Casimicrobiaceae bacterium]
MHLPWIGDTLLDYGHVQVELCVPPALYERQSADGRFVLGKSHDMVETLARMVADRPVERIFDVGVYKGGSIVLLYEGLHPQRLVGIDWNPGMPNALPEYCRHPDRKDAIGIYLGVNQSDQAALGAICDTEFDGPLDLVIDDASHFYFETRETFRALFPRLREGGLYVIEDWGWAHWPGDHWQKDRGGETFRNQPPLSNLLIELMLMCASKPGLVRNVTFNPTVIYVERGSVPMQPGFEPREVYQNRGDPVTLLGERPAAMALRFDSPTFTIRTR